jgi:hypothetical protein
MPNMLSVGAGNFSVAQIRIGRGGYRWLVIYDGRVPVDDRGRDGNYEVLTALSPEEFRELTLDSDTKE